MANQKIIKKSSTAMGVIATIIIVIALFTILFSWLADNTDRSGVSIDSRYNESYNRIIEQRANLNGTVSDIQDRLQNIEEADNALQVAWNGMKFVGTAVLSLIPLTTVTTGTFSAVSDVASAAGVPPEVIILATMGIIAFVVLIVLANLKGEPKMVD